MGMAAWRQKRGGLLKSQSGEERREQEAWQGRRSRIGCVDAQETRARRGRQGRKRPLLLPLWKRGLLLEMQGRKHLLWLREGLWRVELMQVSLYFRIYDRKVHRQEEMHYNLYK